MRLRTKIYILITHKTSLGTRESNPYWFNMEIFAVIASNALKIRQVFSAAFSLYQQKSLKLNCSHLPMRCFSQDFSAEGCRQADACQIRQAERLQKHPSPGNACSSLVCLGTRESNPICPVIKNRHLFVPLSLQGTKPCFVFTRAEKQKFS